MGNSSTDQSYKPDSNKASDEANLLKSEIENLTEILQQTVAKSIIQNIHAEYYDNMPYLLVSKICLK